MIILFDHFITDVQLEVVVQVHSAHVHVSDWLDLRKSAQLCFQKKSLSLNMSSIGSIFSSTFSVASVRSVFSSVIFCHTQIFTDFESSFSELRRSESSHFKT
jgi:hypothetical protein